MDKKVSAVERDERIKAIFEQYVANGDDVGYISQGGFNFPYVRDGQEGWGEVRVIMHDSWDDDEAYEMRTDYDNKVQARKEKAEKSAKAKAEKAEKVKADSATAEAES